MTRCSRCKSQSFDLVACTVQGVHYGQLVCKACEVVIRWSVKQKKIRNKGVKKKK
jgi:transcription initiation factor TFIIIB Brf1 subunit/transcription initiation factor TFIIB